MKKWIVLLLFLGVSAYGWAYPVTINMDWLYDWGRGYELGGGGWSATNTNPYYHFHSQTNALGNYDDGVWTGFADGKEDAYSIMRITSITGFYNIAMDGYELTAFFYGLDHAYIYQEGNMIFHVGVGGYVDVYKHPLTNYGVTPGTAPDVTDRTGNRAFPPITDGDLVLRLQGAVLGVMYVPDLGRNVAYSYLGYVSPLGVHSDMVFDVIGGSWAPYFDTNTKLNGSDIAFTFGTTAQPNFADGDDDDLSTWKWTLEDGGATGSGDLVPEPSSVALLALGLIGLGLARRKRT